MAFARTKEFRRDLDCRVYGILRGAAGDKHPMTICEIASEVVAMVDWWMGMALYNGDVQASVNRIKRRRNIAVKTTVDARHIMPTTYLLTSGPPFI